MIGVKDNVFEKEAVGKLLLKFSIPSIVSLLIAELYNMVDTIFVGREVGGEAIAALVVVFPIQRFVVAFSMMMAIGASTAVARSNGEKDSDNARRIIMNSMSLIFTIMIPTIVLTSIFKTNIVKVFGASDRIIPYAEDYLAIIIFGSIFQCLSTTMNYIMMALGDRKVALKSTFIGAIGNIIIDAILIIGFSYGVKGAGIGTVVSQGLAFLYSFYHFKNIKEQFNLSYGFKFDWERWKSILSVGFSAFIVEAEDGIVLVILNNLLLLNAGDEGVIILGVISKLSMFLFITIMGISSAMQPIAAYNLGAKNYKKLKEVVKKTAIYALITSTVLWGISMVFAKQLISVFIKDVDIIAKSAKAYRTMIAVFPLISIYYMSIYYFQALGMAKSSFIVSIFRQLIILLPVSVILMSVFNLGALGAWLSYPISDLVSSVTSFILMKKQTKKIDIKIKDTALEAA